MASQSDTSILRIKFDLLFGYVSASSSIQVAKEHPVRGPTASTAIGSITSLPVVVVGGGDEDHQGKLLTSNTAEASLSAGTRDLQRRIRNQHHLLRRPRTKALVLQAAADKTARMDRQSLEVLEKATATMQAKLPGGADVPRCPLVERSPSLPPPHPARVSPSPSSPPRTPSAPPPPAAAPPPPATTTTTPTTEVRPGRIYPGTPPHNTPSSPAPSSLLFPQAATTTTTSDDSPPSLPSDPTADSDLFRLDHQTLFAPSGKTTAAPRDHTLMVTAAAKREDQQQAGEPDHARVHDWLGGGEGRGGSAFGDAVGCSTRSNGSNRC